MPEHHPIFARYDRWRGVVPPGTSADFLGTHTRFEYFVTAGAEPSASTEVAEPGLPLFNEEYFEWVDVLEAVDEADGVFTMVELGAGWGRWLAIGAAAARQRALAVRLIGVEAEPSHFRWLRQHLRENGIADSEVDLHEAAVAESDGRVNFFVGDPVAWYGQAIDRYSPPPTRSVLRRLLRRPPSVERAVVPVRALALSTLLRPLPRVDLIDLDVQSAEPMCSKLRRWTSTPRYAASTSAHTAWTTRNGVVRCSPSWGGYARTTTGRSQPPIRNTGALSSRTASRAGSTRGVPSARSQLLASPHPGARPPGSVRGGRRSSCSTSVHAVVRTRSGMRSAMRSRSWGSTRTRRRWSASATGATATSRFIGARRETRRFSHGDDDGHGTIAEPDFFFERTVLASAMSSVTRGREVHTVDLDSCIRDWDLGTFDFLKTDTDGADHDVLTGAGETLRSVLAV